MFVNKTITGVQDFLTTRPVFTVAEFSEWYGSRREIRERTIEALLAYHVKRGHPGRNLAQSRKR